MADLFRTRDHVADFDSYVRDFAARSAATRSRLSMVADLAYGPTEAERLDLFLPPPGMATGAVHMFVHGGYWRMFAKDDFSFVAETVTQAGAIAVIPDYALMPAVRMETIVAQVRRARDWIGRHIAAYGGDAARLTVSGHSAGGHLCALLIDESQPARSIASALLLSGLYDLAPLQCSFLQQEIALTDHEVACFSPLTLRYADKLRVDVLVGGLETAPFHEQADTFAVRLTDAGLNVTRDNIAGGNHMSVVADLGQADRWAGAHLMRLLQDSRPGAVG